MAAVAVRALVAGNVVSVRVSPGETVPPGTALVDLDPAPYRSRLAAAQRRMAEAEARARRALHVLAAQERTASVDVGVAVDGARALSSTGANGTPPAPDPAAALALTGAAQRVQQAQQNILRVLRAQAATAGETVDRDRTLLAQGAIPAAQLTRDQAAYQALREQANAAASAAQGAQTPGTVFPTADAAAGRGRTAAATAGGASAVAPAGPADANARAQNARNAVTAAQHVVDRDTALLADGAIPAKQLETDTSALDAARARADAAEAVVHQQEVRRDADAAARRHADAARRAAAAQAKRAAGVETRARRAEARILEAEQRALELDAAQREVADARSAVAAAKHALDGTVVRAPVQGRIARVAVASGQSVAAGQPLLSLFVPDAVASAMGPPSSRGTALAGASGRAGARAGGPDPITVGEQRVLARLQQESIRIQAIIVSAGSEPRRGPFQGYLGEGLTWPVEGWISSAYGWRLHPIFHTAEFHTGVDIAAAEGTPVRAAADGRVIFTGWMPANGNLVILDHGGGLSTTYSHLSSFGVRRGDRVQRGEVIAAIGSTGWSTGPHLFLEVRQNGRPVDPLRP